MSDKHWQRKTIKGQIVNIAKDFQFNDRETGEPKRCLRFRLQVGADLQPCVAFAEIADEIAALGTGRATHSFEIVHRPGSEEVRVNFVLKGQAAQVDLRKEENDRREFLEAQEKRGFKRVRIKSGSVFVPVWKPAIECTEINGIWHHNLELAMDRLGAGNVLKTILGLKHNRSELLMELKRIVETSAPVEKVFVAPILQQYEPDDYAVFDDDNF